MTKRERFMTALCCGIPDVVPVAPLIHSRYAYKLLGRADWRAVFEVHQMLGSICFRGPIGVGVLVQMPEGWEYSRSVVSTEPNGRLISEIILKTPKRTLLGKHVSGMIPHDPLVGRTVEYPVKSKDDWEVWIDYHEQWISSVKGFEFETVNEALAVMGEDGIASVGLVPAFTMAGEARGMQDLLLDLVDYPKVMEEVMQIGRQVMLKHVESFLASPAEVAWLDVCWATGANIGPKMFERWVLSDIIAAMELVRGKPGKYLGLYTLGRVRELLPMFVDAGVHFIETFEPNQGDITLAEAKLNYGGKVCIMGNFNCLVLSFGTVEDARRETLRCLKEGMEGGGYILVTGDEVPADAKWENLKVMVETVEEHGRYVA
ncbi:MAG: uroporphyrinogen decarboxylase family protein [Armatimonadota bacterium]|nr:uroporphyrinogen decarboxylase family protein [Armatimonadota bacterium]MCX7778457.1 uroporphyrinogen decarboxylase family protein [Armatimonadota bacterium]MDW8026522.1 uroporphyrinogen decarboxylase family protein [Armatimonadota bacterium]